MHDDIDKPSVLLCSYSWSQEAQRIGALINHKSPQFEELEGTDVQQNRQNPFQDQGPTGAFAYFGPSQVREMYPWITRSGGKHMIIGESRLGASRLSGGALESTEGGVH